MPDDERHFDEGRESRGERVARIEGRLERSESDIRELRIASASHGDRLQLLNNVTSDIRILFGHVPARIDRLDEEVTAVKEDVLPTVSKSLKELSEEIREIGSTVKVNSASIGLGRSAFLFTVEKLLTPVVLLYLAWLIAHKP